MSANLQTIKTPEDFQQQLSQDLERVSVTNFWAAWAEPCKQMNLVVEALAQKHQNVLFLNVDAEALPDISDSFEIESVPAFVILKGHTLLGKITGADAKALTTEVEKYSAPAAKALSTSETAPAPPPVPQTNGKSTTSDAKVEPKEEVKKEETTEELNDRMRGIMNSDKVVLFMKGTPDAPRCGFSRQTVALLRENDVKFTHFDILQDEAVRSGLKVLNDWPTFPQIIIGGELLGGLDVLRDSIKSGEFREALESAGAA